jgi:hypothetical protein
MYGQHRQDGSFFWTSQRNRQPAVNDLERSENAQPHRRKGTALAQICVDRFLRIGLAFRWRIVAAAVTKEGPDA